MHSSSWCSSTSACLPASHAPLPCGLRHVAAAHAASSRSSTPQRSWQAAITAAAGAPAGPDELPAASWALPASRSTRQAACWHPPHGDVLLEARAEAAAGDLAHHAAVRRDNLAVLPGGCARGDEAHAAPADALGQVLLDDLGWGQREGQRVSSRCVPVLETAAATAMATATA